MVDWNPNQIPGEFLKEAELTDEQKELIRQRWSLVEFIDKVGLDFLSTPSDLREDGPLDMDRLRSSNYALNTLYFTNQAYYSRFCDALRLPNVLLFGSDANGPNYTNSFLNLLSGSEVDLFTRVLTHQKEWKQKFPNRIFNRSALQHIIEGVPPEELVHASYPGIHHNGAHLSTKANGMMTVFYDTRKVRPLQDRCLQVSSPDAVAKVAVYWKAPLELR